MSDFWVKAGGVLKTVAPVIGAAIGGPLAGVAVRAVQNALGLSSDSTEDEIARAVLSADPAQLLALKRAEQEFILSMRQLEIDVIQLEAFDKDSARRREVEVKDSTPTIFAFVVLAAFLGTLAAFLGGGVAAQDKEVVYLLVGTLLALVKDVVSYYFGTTLGSMQKNQLLADKPPSQTP